MSTASSASLESGVNASLCGRMQMNQSKGQSIFSYVLQWKPAIRSTSPCDKPWVSGLEVGDQTDSEHLGATQSTTHVNEWNCKQQST